MGSEKKETFFCGHDDVALPSCSESRANSLSLSLSYSPTKKIRKREKKKNGRSHEKLRPLFQAE